MSKRTSGQQSKHNNEVERLARYYQGQDYKVDADLADFNQPKVICKKRPDIIARNGKEVVIVEVETLDSIDKDEVQREVFQKYANGRKNVRFWTKVAK